MDTQQFEPNEKRPNDEFEPEQNKRMRPETPEEVIETTNITDLDNDCLEYIFKILDLDDLLNVADSNKHFKQAADLVYASKYGHMSVHISVEDPEVEPIDAKLGCISFLDLLSIYDTLTALRLIRCFGHLILHLSIDYAYQQWSMVDQYVNEYCTDSLYRIDLHYASEYTMENLTKPFSEVDDVRFIKCNLRSKLIDFNKWFPQMQNLKIHGSNTVANRSYIEKNFPNLQHLWITDINRNKENILFDRSNIAKVVRLNPQLQSLTVYGDTMDAVFIQSISNHLQSVENLNISCEHFFRRSCRVTHFRNVSTFKLATNYISELMPKIPLSFDRLEKLTLHVNKFQMNSDILDFIKENRTSMTKLNLTTDPTRDPLKNMNKTDLATAMELLTKINLGSGVLSLNEVTEFLDICKTLEKFRFTLAPHSEYDDLSERVSGKWCLTQLDDEGYIKMERI